MGWRVVLSLLFAAGWIAEVALLVVLLVRRQYRQFPVFTAYIAFNLLGDLAVGAVSAGQDMTLAGRVSLFLLPLQYLLELSVLFEVSWHVLRPVQPSLPRRSIQALLLLACMALPLGAWIAWHVNLQGSGRYAGIKISLDLAVGLLRMLIFALLAGFAQLLGIGWRSKVLRLASALALYSAGDLLASLVQSRIGASNALDDVRAGLYALELGLLLWAFTTKDVRRQDFSPQMEQFLLTISGRAKHIRAAVLRTQGK